jgi:regulator of nucleoside diphosphate kinase
MKEQAIIMTWPDHARLTELVDAQRYVNQGTDSKAFQQLRRELERAQLVTEKDIPTDVVTMDSQVQVFDLEMGDQYVFTLSWPYQQKTADDRINVLAPLGMALLGSRVGQEIEWPLPDGTCRLRVEEVLFQPESNTMYQKTKKRDQFEPEYS